jgi:molybdopterin-containing oxidoreductase family membrane subunit
VGEYSLAFWIMVICNSVVPLLFFTGKVRRSIPWLFGISILINIGMWYERFVIIIGGVAHDFMPNAWGTYLPSMIEFGILVGSFSLFFFLFLLFVKHLPSVSMTEMKESVLKGGAHAA